MCGVRNGSDLLKLQLPWNNACTDFYNCLRFNRGVLYTRHGAASVVVRTHS